MRTLVTGAAGFIGSTLVDRLLDEGHQVVGVDNLSTGRLDNLVEAQRANTVRPGCFSLAVCDITTTELAGVVASARPEVVFHLAAQADVRLSVVDSIWDARTNILGTVNLLEACHRAGVRRVVYAASGGSLYGDPRMLPVGEEAAVSPRSPYAASKASGELYLGAFAGMYDQTPVSLALANVYGPRQDPRGEAGVVSIFSDAMLAGRPTVIYGDGSAIRDYVYVDDVIDAFVRAGRAPVARRRFNIGTRIGTTVADLHCLIAEIVGVPDRPQYVEPRIGEIHAITLDDAAARRDLGWKSTVDLREGVRRTVAWLRSRTDSLDLELLGSPGFPHGVAVTVNAAAAEKNRS